MHSHCLYHYVTPQAISVSSLSSSISSYFVHTHTRDRLAQWHTDMCLLSLLYALKPSLLTVTSDYNYIYTMQTIYSILFPGNTVYYIIVCGGKIIYLAMDDLQTIPASVLSTKRIPRVVYVCMLLIQNVWKVVTRDTWC